LLDCAWVNLDMCRGCLFNYWKY